VPGWRVFAWPAPTMEHLTFRVGSGGHPALQNRLVRQALAFGIDRAEIARVLLFDAPPRDRRPLDSTVFLPSERDYQPSWSGYRYSPGRARRLLEQAGCRRGSDDVYACDGQRLSLRFVTTAGRPERAAILRLVQTQLRRAGVEVVPSFVPDSVLFGRILPDGAYDAALFAWVTNGGGGAWPEADCWDVQNWSGYCTRLVAREYQQVDLVLDRQQRARVLHALDDKLARAVPVLPLVQTASRVALRSHVRGVITHGGSVNVHFAQNSEDWWLAQGH
jgi:peptide/nickel transport system substrate-binding protein